MPALWHWPAKAMQKTDSRQKRRRRQALQWGHYAEWLAMGWLMMKGYWPLARRYRGMGGEVDLIMRRSQSILFIEVKARNERDTGLLAIDSDKILKFNKAVSHWLMRNPWAETHLLRGDAVIICPWRWPLHVKDAFTLTA